MEKAEKCLLSVYIGGRATRPLAGIWPGEERLRDEVGDPTTGCLVDHCRGFAPPPKVRWRPLGGLRTEM